MLAHVKKFIIGTAALCMTIVAEARDNSSCEALLQTLSDTEMKARKSYLGEAKGDPSQLMADAAKSFDTFVHSCDLGPMAYAGVLIHGRLSLLQRAAGKIVQADIAAASAVGYAEALRKHKIAWPEVEHMVREADRKQRSKAN